VEHYANKLNLPHIPIKLKAPPAPFSNILFSPIYKP
jgi:hypothetical protein